MLCQGTAWETERPVPACMAARHVRSCDVGQRLRRRHVSGSRNAVESVRGICLPAWEVAAWRDDVGGFRGAVGMTCHRGMSDVHSPWVSCVHALCPLLHVDSGQGGVIV